MIDNKNNSGNYNSGDCNSGYYNSGYYNSGNCNSGDRNSGNCNSGDYNSGYRNSGDCNSGDCNSGYCNSGYYNSGDCNSGFFNTNTPKVRLFNNDSNLEFDSNTLYNIRSIIFNNVKSVCTWIYEGDMTDKEKEDNPTHETTGGYLKTRDYKYCWQKGWEKMSAEDKQAIKDLPNFDAKIFEEITGVNVCENKKKVTLELTDEQLTKIQTILNIGA